MFWPKKWHPFLSSFTTLSLGLSVLALVSCGGHSGGGSNGQVVSPTPTPVHWDFTINLTIGGKDTPAWSSAVDPQLRDHDYDEFYSTGKLDVALQFLPTNQPNAIFPDYRNRQICKDFEEGYTAIAGYIYARQKLDNGAWSAPEISPRAAFFLTKDKPYQKFSFTQKDGSNASIAPGHYKLEISNLSWDGPCRYFKTAQSCGSTGMRNLDAKARYPNEDGGENFYYCVNLALSASWNEYTPPI